MSELTRSELVNILKDALMMNYRSRTMSDVDLIKRYVDIDEKRHEFVDPEELGFDLVDPEDYISEPSSYLGKDRIHRIIPLRYKYAENGLEKSIDAFITAVDNGAKPSYYDWAEQDTRKYIRDGLMTTEQKALYFLNGDCDFKCVSKVLDPYRDLLNYTFRDKILPLRYDGKPNGDVNSIEDFMEYIDNDGTLCYFDWLKKDDEFFLKTCKLTSKIICDFIYRVDITRDYPIPKSLISTLGKYEVSWNTPLKFEGKPDGRKKSISEYIAYVEKGGSSKYYDWSVELDRDYLKKHPLTKKKKVEYLKQKLKTGSVPEAVDEVLVNYDVLYHYNRDYGLSSIKYKDVDKILSAFITYVDSVGRQCTLSGFLYDEDKKYLDKHPAEAKKLTGYKYV